MSLEGEDRTRYTEAGKGGPPTKGTFTLFCFLSSLLHRHPKNCFYRIPNSNLAKHGEGSLSIWRPIRGFLTNKTIDKGYQASCSNFYYGYLDAQGAHGVDAVSSVLSQSLLRQGAPTCPMPGLPTQFRHSPNIAGGVPVACWHCAGDQLLVPISPEGGALAPRTLHLQVSSCSRITIPPMSYIMITYVFFGFSQGL